MLPLSLKITNFLAYRDEVQLDFDGIRLACLTGHNGAGKSSILDAITFALWGKGRAGNADMIHTGQKESIVELQFEHHGSVYRVVRRSQRGKTNKQTCDFFSVGEDGSLNNLGAQLRETDAKIVDLIRLPYDTFITSAYLQQGKADAFTVMQPSGRKKLLSQILGIDDWAIYETRAKERREELKKSLSNIDGRMAEIASELAYEPEKRDELHIAQAAQAQAEAEVTTVQQQMESTQSAEQLLKDAEKRKAELTRLIERLRGDISGKQNKAAEIQREIDQRQAVLANEQTIAEGYERLLDAQRQNEELNTQVQRMRPLEQRRNEIERVIDAERAQLEKEIASQQATIAQLHSQAQASHDARLDELAAEIAVLEALEAEREHIQAEANQFSDRQGSIRSQHQQLEEDAKKRKAQIQRLESVTDPLCPTCGQPLSDEHRANVLGEWNAEVESLRQAYRNANEELLSIQQQIAINKDRQDDISSAVGKLARLRQEQGQLQQSQKTAASAQAKLTEATALLDGWITRLNTEDYALGPRAQLHEVTAELEQMTYNSDDHEALKSALTELRAFDKAHQDLEKARMMLPRDREALDSIHESIEHLTRDHDESTEYLRQIEESLPVLVQNLAHYREMRTQWQQANQRLDHARGIVITIQQELGAIESKKERLAKLELDAADTRQQISRYAELVAAFGKNGVPAMIIEAAIPELEDLANDLLRRMTNGRMNLRLKTQQATQSGGINETLDIEIADDLGTRNYEMYSGGEAFRVNFALRVALSKLVARRAGSNLQTLFIDEGFGTQDEEGRHRLVEAITAVQNDFDLILVITHMEDLRDAFPVHITVEKTPNGSQFVLR